MCDDERFVRLLASVALTKAGYTTITVTNGDDALAAVSERRIDAIVLDLSMPGRSGVDVLRHLRRERSWAIPVIVVSAHTQRTDREASVAAGATCFIPKPFSPAHLVSQVDAVIDASRAGVCRAMSSDIASGAARSTALVGTRW